MAFTQTAHTLVPANPKDLMSVRPNSEVAKRTIVPISAAMVTRAYVPVYTWNGGIYGDDQTVAETNVLVDDQGLGDYAPRTQLEKANMPGLSPPNAVAGEPDFVFSTVVNSPRGWIDPAEPYQAPPVSPTDDPTVTSLTPNSGASAGAPIWVKITGTKFTPYSTVETGMTPTPYFRYFSPTRIDMLQDPRSTPGTVTVAVRDHGVLSNAATFTFT